MRRILPICCLLTFMTIFATAQLKTKGVVVGHIIDSSIRKPLEYVSVAICNKNDSSIISGAISNTQGDFRIDKLGNGNYFARLTFIGFETKNTAPFTINNQSKTVDLGIVPLSASTQSLSEITVRSEKSVYNNSIDRKIYNVDKDIMSQNGSVSDLLQNIPSVQVDLDGNVSLRGSESVLILINGKPSVLMGTNRASVLQQMPANSIERIEVITNPSAKYKPDGTSGILNIILKKSNNQGLNGSISGNVGNSERYNSTLSANYNTGKINFFGTYGFRQDDRPRSASDVRTMTDITTGKKQFFDQYNTEYARPVSHLGRLGLDFSPDERNTFGVSGTFNYQSFFRTETSGTIIKNNERTAISNVDRLRADNEFERETEIIGNYEHKFDDEGHELQIEYSYQGSFEEEDNKYTNVNHIPVAPDSYDNTLIQQGDKERLLYVEYAWPVSENIKIEAGYVGEFDSSDLNFKGEYLDPATGNWVKDVEKSNRFLFNETIHAFYSTFGHTLGSFSYQLGLRAEQSNIKSHLVTTGEIIPSNYFRLYPTVHFAYKLSESGELQLNYSHRVNRPEGDDLNPFPEYRDLYNIQVGNPHLKPEDIHSVEFGYQWQGDVFSIIPTIYYRYKYNGFTNITEAISETVLRTTKMNLSNDQSTGAELIMSLKQNGKLNVNLSTNAYYQTIDASGLGYNASKSAFSWFSNVNANVNLSESTLLQVNSYYRAPRLTPQGKYLSEYQVNLGVRQDFLKKKLSAIFTISDVLNSVRRRAVIDTPWMIQNTNRVRNSRYLYLGFVYHFGSSSKKEKNNSLEFDNAI